MDAPNGVTRKPYNGETVLTANGVAITDGLRVFTNNLDQGTVDLSRAEYEWNHSEGRYVLWFDVNIHTDYKGNPVSKREPMSDDRVTTRDPFTGQYA